MNRGTPQEIAALKVGDTLYHMSENRRVYPKGGGACIYAEHFRPVQIVGETDQSWLVGERSAKVNKKTFASARDGDPGSCGYFTKGGMDAMIWIHENRYKIGCAVQTIDSVPLLKEVARIIGYKTQ